MFWNIVKMGLVVTLFLVLVGGAIYIVARPTGARAGFAAQDSSGWGAGRRMVSAVTACDDCGVAVGRGSGQATGGGQGGGWAAAETGRGSGLQGSGQRGQVESGGGRGQGGQANSLWNETVSPDWESIEGAVLESGSELLVKTADGEILVGLGQEFYRQEQGFSVSVGDTVRVDGFYEDGEFKAGSVENLTTGAQITLRDASGRPMWPGRGNRQNQA